MHKPNTAVTASLIYLEFTCKNLAATIVHMQQFNCLSPILGYLGNNHLRMAYLLDMMIPMQAFTHKNTNLKRT
jgi:hypothetical protein